MDGGEVRQDLAISLDMMHKLVECLEEEYKLSGDVDERKFLLTLQFLF